MILAAEYSPLKALRIRMNDLLGYPYLTAFVLASGLTAFGTTVWDGRRLSTAFGCSKNPRTGPLITS